MESESHDYAYGENFTYYEENFTYYGDNFTEYGDNFTGYGYYEYYSDYEPYKYPIKALWEVPIRGYVTFFIALITLITNAILISVFVLRGQRSPTTIVLTSLAISDSIICISLAPEAVYFNIQGNHKNLYMLYRWCVANHVLYVAHQVFRMISNWLTALLGFQRCIAISLPFKYPTICSKLATSISIACMVVAAILLNLYEGLAIDNEELPIYSSHFYNESLPSGCRRTYSKSYIEVVGDTKKSMMLFYIFSGLLYRILPIVVLVVTTIILAIHLKRQIGNFQSKDKKKGNKKKNEMRRATMIIFVILIIFLVAEIQDGVAYIIYAHELATDQKRQILSEDADIKWDTVSSTLSLLAYAANFWIFFLMSKQFCCALRDIIFARCRKTDFVLNLDSMDGSASTNLSYSKKEESNDVREEIRLDKV